MIFVPTVLLQSLPTDLTGNRVQQELFNIGVKPNDTKVIHSPPPTQGEGKKYAAPSSFPPEVTESLQLRFPKYPPFHPK